MGCHFLLQGIFLTQGGTCICHVSCIGRWVLYHQRHLGSPSEALGRVSVASSLPTPPRVLTPRAANRPGLPRPSCGFEASLPQGLCVYYGLCGVCFFTQGSSTPVRILWHERLNAELRPGFPLSHTGCILHHGDLHWEDGAHRCSLQSCSPLSSLSIFIFKMRILPF